MNTDPAKPGQILTQAEQYARLFKTAKKISMFSSGAILSNISSVRYAIEQCIKAEEEEIRKRIICGNKE